MRNAFLAIEDAAGVGVIGIDAIQRFLALLGTYELFLWQGPCVKQTLNCLP
ncbi:hypothetical protein Syun_022265 [Stephania yunnanensis]|uniref:Uncharacterized protein n=1 Tax=Stephania yunnanensis TaxID=152371 RepID=A0AAP0FK00_9MAGN